MTSSDVLDEIVLFGSLTDPELLEIVLGGVANTQPVSLEDHRVFCAAGETFPLLLPEAGAQASGVLLQGLSDEQVARLDYYEAPYGYVLAPFILSDGRAVQVYVPSDRTYEKGEPWDLTHWQKITGAMTREAAHEIMGLFGKISIEELMFQLGPIRARAQARLNAREEGTVKTLRIGGGRDEVVLEALRRPYSKFFAVDEMDLRHPRFDGGVNQIERTVFMAVDAVVVLPYDPQRDRVMLIEQFRPAPYARGDLNPWMLEAIAGRIDGGESPQEAAHRETLEEAGLAVQELIPAGNFYPSPGALSEYLYCYIGLADIPDDAAGLGGLASEAEDIRSMVVPFAALMEAIDSGEIQNGPLMLCAMSLARQRDGLRAGQ